MYISVYICLHVHAICLYRKHAELSSLWRSIYIWLKSILHYRKEGYLQVLQLLYILYRTIFQFHFLQMSNTFNLFPDVHLESPTYNCPCENTDVIFEQLYCYSLYSHQPLVETMKIVIQLPIIFLKWFSINFKIFN